jgi:hypothetical protein
MIERSEENHAKPINIFCYSLVISIIQIKKSIHLSLGRLLFSIVVDLELGFELGQDRSKLTRRKTQIKGDRAIHR